MPETEGGLNSCLAAAKVKKGGKEMGSNVFFEHLLCCQTPLNSFSDHQVTSDTTESGGPNSVVRKLSVSVTHFCFALLDGSHIDSLHMVAR